MHLTMFVIFILCLCYGFFKWSFSYWSRRNVPSVAPQFLFGNIENPWKIKKGATFLIKEFYDEFKGLGYKHIGLYAFTKPFYVPIHLDLIKNILAKDFQYFSDHGVYYNEKDDPLSAHIFNLNGKKWKSLRAKLTPTFTTGKIKLMFTMLVKCADQLINALNDEMNVSVDIKNFLGCYTTDVIGMCAFGLDCNSFKNSSGDFKNCGKKIFAPAQGWQRFKVTMAILNHKLGRLLHVVTTPEPKAFLMDIVQNVVELRQKTGLTRKDFLQLLIDLKDDTKEPLSIKEIAAQCYVFFAAGFETSSTTMTFCLYELARNVDIQNRLRNEINDTFKNSDFTYDSVMQLKYLNQVIEETLRKYPPAGVITRQCVNDYEVLPDVVIEKGTLVTIPILAIHRDPVYFPDPDKFDPDRFDLASRRNILPFSYMPFGEGPRICIAVRFGLVQIKVALVSLIRHFKFSVNSKTQEPLVMSPLNYILTVKDHVWLDIEKC